jgi:hypothetical protein
MFRLWAEQFNEEKRTEFEVIGRTRQHTDEQKAYAFSLIAESANTSYSQGSENPAKNTSAVVQAAQHLCYKVSRLDLPVGA